MGMTVDAVLWASAFVERAHRHASLPERSNGPCGVQTQSFFDNCLQDGQLAQICMITTGIIWQSSNPQHYHVSLENVTNMTDCILHETTGYIKVC